ncbi:MAG TPA: FAD:protein FMN transferase [Verrucomicrobiales bacterium]|nr:FAD:protein FMN transferase [Verrucomicrobiales bacterium]
MKLPGVHRHMHEAMATRWELHLVCPDPGIARQAALEAFALADRLESRLSRFRAGSEIAVLSHLPAGAPWRVSDATWDCLELALAVHSETHGAFDITLTPLYDPRRCSGDPVIGMEHIHLDADRRCVILSGAPLYLDLGGIGKGYALDEMISVLASWEIENALLISGYSTILAIGNAPDQQGWPVRAGPPSDPPVHLCNQALSASGFETRGWHIVDPRTRKTVTTPRRRSWVFTSSGALADALSTAILVMNDEEIDRFCGRHPQITVMLS